MVDDLSHHTLLRKDVIFYPDRVVFNVYTTKTRRKGEHVLSIPIFRCVNPGFCVWSLLLYHLTKYPASQDSLLLLKMSTGSKPLLYRDVLHFLKNSVSLLGIPPP